MSKPKSHSNRTPKLYEVTTLMYASSLKGVISQASKVGEVVKITLEGKPDIINKHEQTKRTIGFINDKSV